MYPLRNIKNFPIALFGGSSDLLATKKDVDWLSE
jgi:hypothetical protein